MLINEIENIINHSTNNYIIIEGDKSFIVNLLNLRKKYNFQFKGIIDVYRSDCVIDFTNATLEINLENFNSDDVSFLYIHPTSKNIILKNLNLIINVDGSYVYNNVCMGIYNTSKNLKIIDSSITIKSDKGHKLIGIYNNGNLFTHMDTRADNLIVDNTSIEVVSIGNIGNNYSIYGIYNNLANSILVTNNDINVKINGKSDAQKAIGIYTNGRYGRFIGNNIKANGSHPAGLELEQASAYGFNNEGLFTIINANNIVAQWAGRAIGIKTNADEALITSNKILATHSMLGKCICNSGNRVVINSNILATTSKNAKMVEHNGNTSIINGNVMEVLLNTEECITGCGIYSDYPDIGCNTFTSNIMFNMKTCGLFVKPNSAIIANNQLASSDFATLEVLSYNQEIKDLLDESHIKIIVRE